jgi:hypothetical protein
MSGRWWYRGQTAKIRLGSSGSSTMFWAMPTLSSNRNVTFSWEALSCIGISSQFLQDWQTTFQFFLLKLLWYML